MRKISGLVVGKKDEKKGEKIYCIGEDVHSLCIGATRCGKSRNVVLPTIGNLALAGESMVISDIKGELHAYTAIMLKRLGYKIITLDFKNPLKSSRYNFLEPIIIEIQNGNIPKAIDLTWDLTTALVGKNKESREKIWNNGEASIIASSIMSVIVDNQKNKKYQNLTNVYFFIGEMCKTIGMKMPIIEYNKSLPDNHPAKGLLAVSEVAPKNTKGSFYTSALTTLRLFTSPLINSMTNTSDFKLGDIGNEKTAVFIILPHEKETYYPLASLIVSQIYVALMHEADLRGGRLKNRVNYVLDEFGNFVDIPGFANMLTAGGSAGIRFNLFIQGLTQLDEKYGKDVSKIIQGNCENWLYLQSDDPETLDVLSKKLGKYTVRTYSLSASQTKNSNSSSSQSVNLTGRELLTTDEIKRIKRPYSLVFSRGYPAIMYAPDLSEWNFNTMFGLGDKEHNRKIRIYRDNNRPERTISHNMDLWGIWKHYQAKLEREKESYY